MKNKIMKKIGLIGGVCAAMALGLTACHQAAKNPLQVLPKAQVAKFIYNAESEASKVTHLYDATQSVYAVCVTNPTHFNTPFAKNAINPCEAYFKAMANYAKTTKAFNSVTVENLKNPKVLNRIKVVLHKTEALGGTASNDAGQE